MLLGSGVCVCDGRTSSGRRQMQTSKKHKFKVQYRVCICYVNQKMVYLVIAFAIGTQLYVS